jgi:hypothetical protein
MAGDAVVEVADEQLVDSPAGESSTALASS